MKFFLVFVALFAVALAAPVEHHDSKIIHLESDVHPEGFRYIAETSDGTHKEEEGHLKDVGSEHEAIVVHGSFSWVDEKTGEKFTVTYVADEHGFHPEGAHLPQSGDHH